MDRSAAVAATLLLPGPTAAAAAPLYVSEERRCGGVGVGYRLRIVPFVLAVGSAAACCAGSCITLLLMRKGRGPPSCKITRCFQPPSSELGRSGVKKEVGAGVSGWGGPPFAPHVFLGDAAGTQTPGMDGQDLVNS